MMRVTFDKKFNRALYRMHNRILDGQLVFVWKSGPDFLFIFHDEPFHPPARRDWAFLGELAWSTKDGRFVYELHPVRRRDEIELKERAQRTEAHRERRRDLWSRYRLEQRLADILRS